MTKLGPAIVYDIEVLPNAFTFAAVDLWSDGCWYFEISFRRDDRAALMMFFMWLRDNSIYMIGFNNLHYDYQILHMIFQDLTNATPANVYAKSQEIINSSDRFSGIWESDRFAPQIDLFKIHHFDNVAKSTSLKALQINMRSESVLESKTPWNVPVTAEQLDGDIIPYNFHDVTETKKFALISMPMIELRLEMAAHINGDVLNFNDTKIGKQLLEQRLGEELTHYRDQFGRKKPRQSIRDKVELKDCVFPYIYFNHPEFQRIHQWVMQQTIYADTNGIFKDVTATIRDFTFVFGVGGIHGSVERRKFVSDDEWVIEDIDVTGLYPSIAIVNRLYPEHLGERYITEYTRLRTERNSHKKGTAWNSTLKLASNGVYGDSNNPYSIFYDTKYMLQTTINGQLLLSMLAEWLLTVPTLTIIQINTDGITYHVHRTMCEFAASVQKQWEQYTCLDLEKAIYSRMWIRDVNNYMAETADTGKLKLKGAYWTPTEHPGDIQNSSPTAWYKDFSADITAKAAVEYMTKGTDIATFIHGWTDMFDFMCREKVKRSDKLYIGDVEQQRVTRYYVARQGQAMRKVAPCKHPERIGRFKPAMKTTEADYLAWHSVWGNVHNPEIHTKNKSVYGDIVTSIQAGLLVEQCNHIRDFRFDNLNYDWYINEAKKLVIT